jgi:hypothetical protein
MPRRSGSTSLPLSLLFISPSTRENSTSAHLKNNKQLDKLSQVLTVLGHEHQIGVGHWTDGAEEVAVAKVPTERVHKVAAKLGNAFRQKSVLWFTPGEGDDYLHHVTSGKPEGFHTELPDGSSYVVTQGAPAPLTLPHTVTKGRATFLGGDTRDEAAEVFKHVMGK